MEAEEREDPLDAGILANAKFPLGGRGGAAGVTGNAGAALPRLPFPHLHGPCLAILSPRKDAPRATE